MNVPKDIPEYDENIVCENPVCKHIEAAAITGLYGIVGGGGLGIYSVCEYCGFVLSKSVCDTQEYELIELGNKRGTENADEDSESNTKLDK
jgi:hypothetical protein